MIACAYIALSWFIISEIINFFISCAKVEYESACAIDIICAIARIALSVLGIIGIALR